MTQDERDPLVRALAELPIEEVDAWRKAHIRLQAQRALRLARSDRGVRGLYRRSIEPISVAIFSTTYVAWAFLRVLSIWGG